MKILVLMCLVLMFLKPLLSMTTSTPTYEEPNYVEDPSAVKKVEKMIQLLTHRKNEDNKRYAQSIVHYSKQYNVNPKIVVGVLMTESTFRQTAVSSTGDLGIGQINPGVWSREFVRLNKRPLDINRLKKSPDYAIDRTVEILSLLKDSNDPNWFGKYHSKTPGLKVAYASKIRRNKEKVYQIALNP